MCVKGVGGEASAQYMYYPIKNLYHNMMKPIYIKMENQTLDYPSRNGHPQGFIICMFSNSSNKA